MKQNEGNSIAISTNKRDISNALLSKNEHIVKVGNEESFQLHTTESEQTGHAK